MPVLNSSATKIPLESFAAQCNGQMVPLNESLSYFSAIPLNDGELRRLLYDPVAAVPPRVSHILSSLQIVLVPYLEKGPAGPDAESRDGANHSKGSNHRVVNFERPAQNRQVLSAVLDKEKQTLLFLAVKDEEVADYHYTFFEGLAGLVVPRADADSRSRFEELLSEELKKETHGEIDEKSWRLKEQLIRRQADPSRGTKLRQNYFRQALQDSLTLYLHGLCCDIDVDSGPRQLASRYIRRRLILLREVFPPPEGVALFPEELPPQRSH